MPKVIKQEETVLKRDPRKEYPPEVFEFMEKLLERKKAVYREIHAERSAAAKKGWQRRRRREAALKGWEKRRASQEVS